jgi:alpha-mannosidase
MHKHSDLTLQRIRLFAEDLSALWYPERHPLDLLTWAAPGRVAWAEAMQGAYRPARVGERFGPAWSTHWFKVSARIPEAWAGREVHLLWDSKSEACVWKDGRVLQGLTGATANNRPIRAEFPVTGSARGGEEVAFEIEMACNHLFGLQGAGAAGELTQAEIAVFDREAWALYWDLRTLYELAKHLPESEPRRAHALFEANAIVNACRRNDRSTWPAARARARAFLEVPNGPAQHEVSAVGHAHLDSAWLWPMAETKRKCYRTFASVLRLMEEYPDFIFACSQAVQLDWMRREQPDLYARIRARAAEGRFVPCGGSWVEPDCNLPSGESLARQFLYGQRFFEREFGRRCAEFWNPDVFGYSAQLPQILRRAGFRYFLTQKLSWNQFNRFPHDTFLWEGLDGSRVLTHFPPTDTYNATPDVAALVASRDRFAEADRANESYLLFGYGDGGGGPSRAMMEQFARLRDCAGVPRSTPRAPADFFARCEADLRDPPVWVGELYLELHRGTYTTQAANKRQNRRCEFLLAETELFAAVAAALHKAEYPAEELERLWKLVLFNQFHDVLPGSSIREVYEDSERDYAQVLSSGAARRDAALAALAGGTDGWAVANALGHDRREVVECPEGVAGRQPAFDGRSLALVAAPAMGLAPWREIAPAAPAVLRETANGAILENGLLGAEIGRDGRLRSLRIAGGREAVATGETANRFVLFDDRPNNWDAWDVDVFHLEKFDVVPGAQGFRVLERGPLRVTVEAEYRISDRSWIRQRILLCADSPRLEFDTEVEWREDARFLKVEFPVAVRRDHATYEIQFGHLPRPTHFNTSWDLARFEVCAHKWADFSEPDFGVALLNDSKYGHAVHGHVMRLSLLRAPASPDPLADRGRHRFRYALMPHGGDFRAAGVIREAYALNQPLRVRRSRAGLEPCSFFRVEPASLVLETVKKAEDSEALIVRMYEAFGSRGAGRLTSSLPVGGVWRTNLLEDPEGDPLEWREGGVEFAFSPHEIVTLRLDPA